MIDRIEQFLLKLRSELLEVIDRQDYAMALKYTGAVEGTEALLREIKREAAMQALSDQTQEIEKQIQSAEAKIAERSKPTRRKRREGNPLPATPPAE